MERKVGRNVEWKVANKNVRKSQRKTTQRKIDQVAAEKEGSEGDAKATFNQCAEPPRRSVSDKYCSLLRRPKH